MGFVVNEPKVICERFESEIIVINLESGSYFSLRGTAADAWLRLEAGQSAEEISSSWKIRFPEVDPTESLQVFLHRLVAEDLVLAAPVQRVEFAGLDMESYSAPVLESYTDMKDLLLLDPVHDVDETGWPVERKA